MPSLLSSQYTTGLAFQVSPFRYLILSRFIFSSSKDVIGRRPVIFIGMLGMNLATLLFGLQRSLVGLLLVRCLGQSRCSNLDSYRLPTMLYLSRRFLLRQRGRYLLSPWRTHRFHEPSYRLSYLQSCVASWYYHRVSRQTTRQLISLNLTLCSIDHSSVELSRTRQVLSPILLYSITIFSEPILISFLVASRPLFHSLALSLVTFCSRRFALSVVPFTCARSRS